MSRRMALIWVIALAYFVDAASAQPGPVLRVDGNIVKWVAPATGSVTVITYATLTESYALPTEKRTLSQHNCGTMRPFAEVAAVSSGISDAMAKQQLRSAFAAWESVAALKFVEVSETSRADIIIGATDGSAGRAFANISLAGDRSVQPVAKALGVTHAPVVELSKPTPNPAVAIIERAFICLNPNVRWKTEFDGNLEVYDLRFTLMHEIGHAIGLDHPGNSGSIMGYRYDEVVAQLQPTDIAAVRGLYGMPLVD